MITGVFIVLWFVIGMCKFGSERVGAGVVVGVLILWLRLGLGHVPMLERYRLE